MCMAAHDGFIHSFCAMLSRGEVPEGLERRKNDNVFPGKYMRNTLSKSWASQFSPPPTPTPSPSASGPIILAQPVRWASHWASRWAFRLRKKPWNRLKGDPENRMFFERVRIWKSISLYYYHTLSENPSIRLVGFCSISSRSKRITINLCLRMLQ